MKVTIEWEYKAARLSKRVRFVSDPVSVHEAVQLAMDIERTGRLGSFSFLDEKGVYWSKKELQKMIAIIETEPTEVTGYFDGGFQKDSRESGQGSVLFYTQNNKPYRVRTNAAYTGILSNNESEYAALWLLVNEMERSGVQHASVTVKGDSMVVINQMNGEWPCYEEELQKWMDKIEKKLEDLKIQVTYELISRNENKEADTLATQALHKRFIHGKKEIID